MARTYTFTITVEIDDEQALAAAARHRATLDGATDADWDDTRDGVTDPIASDLIMLLDPGSLDGVSILSSSASEDE